MEREGITLEIKEVLFWLQIFIHLDLYSKFLVFALMKNLES